MATQVINTIKLKEGVTDAKYQSTFLPIFQDAETRIKMLILLGFLNLKSPMIMRLGIATIINEVAAKIPETLHDKQAYIEGMKKRAEIYIRQFYNRPKALFERVQNRIYTLNITSDKLPKIVTPKDLIDFTKDKSPMWAEAKGIPTIANYEQEVYKTMDQFAQMPMTTYEPGKKPISLWQKAELDVRYTKQMDMLQQLLDTGVELAYTSSHADCSKRCEKWQGKLMSLTQHATMSGFRVGKVDGKWVYSLPDIMAQTDKYGYHNNIICGFNCRHRLIPYDPKKAPPSQYSKEEVAKQREIETRIREMERQIRMEKTRLLFYKQLGEKKIVKSIENRVKMLIEHYKRFCERNGYAWFQYRINIREGMNQYL